MRYAIVPVRELHANQWAIWSRIQQTNASLQSPYFCPQFAQAVATVRENAFVVVMENAAGEPQGFFPFERSMMKTGKPIGGALSDFHGAIIPNDLEFDAREMIGEAGLQTWKFDHLLANQRAFAPYHIARQLSPYMDLSKGYEAYAQERRQAGSEQIKKTGNLRRRIEREVGPLRFVAHDTSRRSFQALLKWKSTQYLQSQATDVFSYDWPVLLIERLLEVQQPEFAGMFSSLYVGDRLVAAHLGMRSGRVWHYWFPSYDEEYSKYSPGLILLLMMAEAAPGLGLQIIDLGKGDMLYKQRLASGNTEIAEGCIETGGLAPVFRQVRMRAEMLATKPNLPNAAKIPAKVFRRIERWQRFR